MEKIYCRSATINDIDTICEIENISSARWSRNLFEKELQTSFSHVIIAEIHNEIAGFVIAWNIAGEIEIQNIAVHKDHRRKGIGTELILHTISILKKYKPQKILIEVRENNYKARAFYKSLAFYETGKRKKYYNNEDAILMERAV